MDYIIVLVFVSFVLIISTGSLEAGNGIMIDAEMEEINTETATFGLG